MKSKFLLGLVLALVTLISFGSVLAEDWIEYSEPDINEMTVYVNGNAIWHGYCVPTTTMLWECRTYQYAVPAVERGSQMTVRVVFKPGKDLDNVKVSAWIHSYRREIEARTVEFDVFKENLYIKTLVLNIPSDIEARDSYTLYVKITKNKELCGVDEAKVNIDIQKVANVLSILSADIYSVGRITPGSVLYADVVVKNMGNHIAKDVYVRISIKQLGIIRNIYLGNLEAGESERASVTIRLPIDASTGDYLVEIEAYNAELSVKTTKVISIEKSVVRKIEIIPQVTEATVTKGETAKYSLLVVNSGDTKENFVVEVLGTEGWSTVTITPATFTLAPGESKLVSIDLNVGEVKAGKYPFTVKIKYGSEIRQFNFVTNVSGIAVDVKVILMIIGIILAAVIIVLLVIMLTKQKTSEAEKPEIESYY